MKAIIITYNQSYNEEIIHVLDDHGQRGFTRFEGVDGRGGINGEPHYGNHAWPIQNHVIMTVVEDKLVEPLMKDLKAKDEATPKLGLRAFVLNVESEI